MRDEMNSMARNKVWELIGLPPQCKSTENKWFFKIKRQMDNSIDKVQDSSSGERFYLN